VVKERDKNSKNKEKKLLVIKNFKRSKFLKRNQNNFKKSTQLIFLNRVKIILQFRINSNYRKRTSIYGKKEEKFRIPNKASMNLYYNFKIN